LIEQTGWRTACTAMGILVLAVLAPINLVLRKRPEDIGLLPDGDAAPSATSAAPRSNVVDPVWAGTDWTLAPRAAYCTIWWIAIGYFCGLYIWYAVQVHQTKIPARHRLQRQRCCVGARRRQPARIPGQICSGICPTGSGANGSGPSAAPALRSVSPR